MGTYGVQLKGILPRLVRWACRTGTRNLYPALAALASPVQIIFFRNADFHFMVSHRTVAWTGSRAGSLIS